MATESAHSMTRRRLLGAGLGMFAGAALPGAVLAAATAGGGRLTATWQRGNGYQLGQLRARDGQLVIAAAFDLPTRGHGLARDLNAAGRGAGESGAILCVARRPGDWLLRWHPDTGAAQWQWSEPQRAFTGHVLASARALYSVETDLASGAGLIGVRDPLSLEKRAEWPTHGIDPHALTLAPNGDLLVANGGVPTRPETGRQRLRAEAVDSSLVRLDAASGALRGQWRLADPELSLRHLAWGETVAGQPLLGIALQAQHDAPEARAQAPVLALWDGAQLRTAEAVAPVAGYGGDIGFAGDRFVVGCPRGDCALHFASDGTLAARTPLPEACAVAVDGTGRLWLGGAAGTPEQPLATPLKLDNHWI